MKLRLYGTVFFEMGIWDIPDGTYVFKGGSGVCVAKGSDFGTLGGTVGLRVQSGRLFAHRTLP